MTSPELVPRLEERLILLVDDREHTREFISEELVLQGHRVIEAFDGMDGWEKFCAHQFDLVVSDLRMPKSDGLELLRRIRSPSSPNPQVPVLLLSAYGTLAIATDAGRAGATAFFSYNESGIEELLAKTDEVLSQPKDPPPELLGSTPNTVELREALESLASVCTPICLCGESGIDFESVARFVHGLGPHSVAEFHAIAESCDLGPAEIRSGTVHLIDLHCSSSDHQRRWLDRIGAIEAQGSGASCRIIASLPGRPRSLAGEGVLLPELGARLNRFCLDIAPLRDRGTDIPQISEALLTQLENHHGHNRYYLSNDAKRALTSHSWYENMDELSRVLEAVIVSAKRMEISGDQIRTVLSRLDSPLRRIASEESRKERARLIELWTRHLTYTGVAEELGVTRNTAKNRMARHNLIPGHAGLPAAGSRERLGEL